MLEECGGGGAWKGVGIVGGRVLDVRRMYSIMMMVVGLESCMEDVGLISGVEQLI